MTADAFTMLPFGAVSPQGYLKTQIKLQAQNITGNMELYPEYSENSGWLGGKGENWERGPYYVRGLVATAYTLNDTELINKAKKWIDWSINSQKENGDFGPCEDLWPKMPMLYAVRDYYLAEKNLGHTDSRVMPFFAGFFKFEEEWLDTNPLSSWGQARGADNAEVILWYCEESRREDDTCECERFEKTAIKIMSQTQDWEMEMREGGKLRRHVVNTTQGLKHPFIKYKLTGDTACLKSFNTGMKSIYDDHGRIDNLPNADESARDCLPTRGTETCAVVEFINSLSTGGYISGDSRLYDLLEICAYNNLPNCFDYDLAGYCYFQMENNVMGCHGTHGFANDHGDSSCFGISGFECCFSNCHLGYPRFIQNLWLKKDDVLVKACYGENILTTELGGKTVIIREETGYPYKDSVRFTYCGEKGNVKIMFRVPGWSGSCRLNGEMRRAENGYIMFEKVLSAGDTITLDFKSKVEDVNFHNIGRYIKKGAAIFCLPINEYWRETTDFSFRGIKYGAFAPTKNYEVYPLSEWRYSFDDLDCTYQENPAYDNRKKSSPDNYPATVRLKMHKVINWELKRNVADTLIDSALFDSKTQEMTLIPTAFSRLKISVFPFRASSPVTEPHNDIRRTRGEDKTDGVKIEKIGGYAMISFPIIPDSEYSIEYSGPDNEKRYIDNIGNNPYKVGGDPYGARIKRDKYAVYVGPSDIGNIKFFVHHKEDN